MGDHSQSRIVRFGAWLGAFIAVISGPVSGHFLARIFLEQRESTNWPSVAGVLKKVAIAERGLGRFKADVAYSYRVGPTEFMGTRIRASDGEYNVRDGAVQAIRGLAVDQKVTVFYDPAQPGRSVLQPGAGFAEYALLFVPVVMLGIGLYLVRQLWRTRQQRVGERMQ